ncbi:stromal interaction molecule homolog isoform X4 [Zeugodacus cucurbitae]|uniref:stromal interaction molecule homolog isoform X4 n=1 Tax=Zeugodacus cucurbitae TaxID=28588 RepID=UPI0023D90491|nr:stromal interaction molecule homolog isoform X4 [Zeugodacus cucurbitae]
MQRKLLLYALLFLAVTSQKCHVVESGGPPSDTMGTIAANRYNAEHQQQQHQHQQQQHLHTAASHHQVATGGGGGGGSNSVVPAPAAPTAATHALYHPTPSGSGHMEHRNSYNLLSEAMSQAVSNEFSSLGSGSADGACHADDLDCYSGNVQDRLGMEAIRTLHRQLDDDDNGNIDLSESDDFLREELKYDSGYEKRQKAFHFNDDMHISVKELWEAWLRSEVHNWTMEQTTDWLAQSVQLPQYVELFRLHKVTGATLPRLAVNNMHYVGNVLGIKDPIHKQKIALKAMDVVLFGPPRETGTRWKDYILVTLLLSAIIGCWYAYQQNKNAKRHLRRMAQDMEGLQRAEQSLQEMQKELERARMEQENVATEKMDLERRLKEAPTLSSSSSDLEVQKLKKEIEILRTELSRAEIELVDNCWTPPPQLQSWLQYTYELESKNHLKKRVSAEKQLQSAREACEKLRKKRSSLVGAFVSTHGKSIDDVDRSIVEARNSLSEVTNELQERLHRWKQIENCLGFNIVNNNGLQYLENVLYNRNGGSSVSSNKGSRGRITSSSDDLDDDSVQANFCDPKARIWYQWKSTRSLIDNSNNSTTRNPTLMAATATTTAYPRDNNSTSAAEVELLENLAEPTRRWSSSTAQLANSPHHPHRRPSIQHHPLPVHSAQTYTAATTSARDNLPDVGHHMSASCQSINNSHSNSNNSSNTNLKCLFGSQCSLCSTSSSQPAMDNNSQRNTLEIKSRSCSPTTQHLLESRPLSAQYPHNINSNCPPRLACNRCAGRHNSMGMTIAASAAPSEPPPPPPPPHLRPLLRRHTVIPKWRTNCCSAPTAPASMAAVPLRSENDVCASPSAVGIANRPAMQVPAAAAQPALASAPTNIHSSHSAGCLTASSYSGGTAATVEDVMTMQKAQEQQEQQQKGNDIDDQRLYDVMDNDNAFKENQYKRNSSHNSADADAEAEAYSQVTLNFAKHAAHAAATARQLNEHDNNNSFSDSQRDLRRAPTSGLTTITAT